MFLMCEDLVRFFSDVKNWYMYQIFTNVKNRYQILTRVKNRYQILTSVETSYHIVTNVKIVSKFTRVKNWYKIVTFFTCCELLVPKPHSVKFTKCEICGYTKLTLSYLLTTTNTNDRKKRKKKIN